MITVKVELWPGGLKDHAMEIGRAYIHNVSNLAPRSNYRGVVCRKGVYEPVLTAMKRATRQISVEGYPRKHLNVWCLITRALLSAFPEERPRVLPEQGELLERVAAALGLPEGASEVDVLSEIALLRSGQ